MSTTDCPYGLCNRSAPVKTVVKWVHRRIYSSYIPTLILLTCILCMELVYHLTTVRTKCCLVHISRRGKVSMEDIHRVFKGSREVEVNTGSMSQWEHVPQCIPQSTVSYRNQLEALCFCTLEWWLCWSWKTGVVWCEFCSWCRSHILGAMVARKKRKKEFGFIDKSRHHSTVRGRWKLVGCRGIRNSLQYLWAWYYKGSATWPLQSASCACSCNWFCNWFATTTDNGTECLESNSESS